MEIVRKELIEKQEWYKSKPLWRAILSIIVILSKEIFDYEIPNELIDNVMTVVLWSAIGYGIRNNPSLKNEL